MTRRNNRYASNKTYMDAVAQLDVEAPEQVPIDQLHPNDVSTALLKHSFDQDQVNASQIEYFRRVYFSMCFEADDLLGQIITALDNTGARKKTFVIMISDHGEDATEHRQCGKNNMYDSASRVAMIISGPGITPGQQITSLASLNDVFPTVLDMVSQFSVKNKTKKPKKKCQPTPAFYQLEDPDGLLHVPQTGCIRRLISGPILKSGASCLPLSLCACW